MQRYPLRLNMDLVKKVKEVCDPGAEAAWIEEAISEKLAKPKPAPKKEEPKAQPEKKETKKEDSEEEKK